LQAGDFAPDVTVTIGNERVRLRDFVGTKRVVLYFYPKDSTPSCTIEAREFNDLLDEFTAAGTEVIGVSTDSAATHARFAQREGLRFSLATDADGALADAFGAANRLVHGIRARRVTFLIDTDGRIARVWDRVNPHTHPLDVLDAVRALTPCPFPASMIG
jgi:thioredoxin-dependent peroxiredoxin